MLMSSQIYAFCLFSMTSQRSFFMTECTCVLRICILNALSLFLKVSIFRGFELLYNKAGKQIDLNQMFTFVIHFIYCLMSTIFVSHNAWSIGPVAIEQDKRNLNIQATLFADPHLGFYSSMIFYGNKCQVRSFFVQLELRYFSPQAGVTIILQIKSNMIRSSQRSKKTQIIFAKNQNNNGIPVKRNFLQSQQFSANVRRHSVYGTPILHHDFNEPFTNRVSSKELKSLQKYKSTNRQQVDSKSLQKMKIRKMQSEGKMGLQHLFLTQKAYKYINMIGKGGFGKVWKVQHTATGRIYAMKEMSKAIIITKRSTQSILNQRQFLATLKHKFLVNMLYAFQDQENLYIIMNIMQGGDLRYHLSKMTVFTQGETKFMIACIIMSLDYLHSKMIIHRDLKPQNIVFDKQGYAYLTDLGITKFLRPDNNQDTSGTPGYMAPEVMFHQNHRYEVDYYALGVIIYEIMMGKRPYIGKSRQEIRQKLKEKQIIIPKRDIPDGWTIEAADFVNKLLQRKPVQRLGWAGIYEIKEHPWLRNFPWNDLISGQLQSPMKRFYNHAEVRYRPTENDTNYCRMLNKNKDMLKKGSLQQQFQGYTFEDYDRSTAENTRIY